MNRKYIICILILVSVIALATNFKNNMIKSKKLNLQFYGEYIVDESGIKERADVPDSIPFTGFIQLKSFNGFKVYEQEFDMDFSMVPYDAMMEECYIAISFGRKLESICYEYQYPYHRSADRADIVFSEEYNEHKMYVYLMDRILLPDSFLEGNSYYVVDGTEQIYLGDIIDDLSYSGTKGDVPFLSTKKIGGRFSCLDRRLIRGYEELTHFNVRATNLEAI